MRMTELTQEERAALEVLDQLNRGEITDPGSEQARAELRREYVELLGLLPYELEPIETPARVWEEIRASLPGAEVAAGKPALSSPRGDRLVRFPTPVPAAPPPPVHRPSVAATGTQMGMFTIAAVLAFLLVGVGYLLARTQDQQRTIALLAGDLNAAQTRQADVQSMRDQFDMVTRVARQVYPMRPVRASERQAPVNGKVFVCGEHQRWYLTIDGLDAAPSGYEYRFWFETGEGQVPGGAVEIRAGLAELSALHMPLGTTGFTVTLERAGRKLEEPEGDTLLEAGEALSM